MILLLSLLLVPWVYAFNAVEAISTIRELMGANGTIACKRPVDVVFVIDDSGSVKQTNFNKCVEFIIEVASSFEFGPLDAQMGVVQYDATAWVSIPLNQSQTAADFISAASKLVYDTAGGTYTNLGINMAADQVAAYGRPANVGGSHLIIILTDGQSNSVAQTIASAQRARSGGSFIALLTFETPNMQEVNGIVNNDYRFWFPVAKWDDINSAGFIQIISQLVCEAPIDAENMTDITTRVPCNDTLYIVYYTNITEPVTVVANVSSGSVILCLSYLISNPSPTDTSGSSYCSTATAGASSIGTTTAYPNRTNIPNPDPGTTLYVSITPTQVDRLLNETCGGNVTISAFYCSTFLVSNVTLLSGNGSVVPSDIRSYFNVSTDGSPLSHACNSCPQGYGFMSQDPNNPLFGLCTSSCPFLSQFLGYSFVNKEMECQACHPSCESCVYPGGPRSCTSCPAGTFLLLNEKDPAITNSMWSAYSSGVAASGLFPAYNQLLSGIFPTSDVIEHSGGAPVGRCVPGCPASYEVVQNDLPFPTPVPSSPEDVGLCVGEVASYSNVTTGKLTPYVMSSFCLPSPTFETPDSSLSCRSYFGTSIVAQIAGSLAATAGVPVSAVYLRACADLEIDLRWIFPASARSPTDAFEAVSPEASQALNVSGGTPVSPIVGCNCSTVLSFAISAAVSPPGYFDGDVTVATQLQRVWTLIALPSNSTIGSRYSSRNAGLMLPYLNASALVNSSDYNFSLPLAFDSTCPYVPPAPLPNDTLPMGEEWVYESVGLAESPPSLPVFLGSCLEYTYLDPSNDSPDALGAAHARDPVTYCLLSPPSRRQITETPIGVILGVPLFIALALLAVVLVMYCRWREKRKRLVSLHTQFVPRAAQGDFFGTAKEVTMDPSVVTTNPYERNPALSMRSTRQANVMRMNPVLAAMAAAATAESAPADAPVVADWDAAAATTVDVAPPQKEPVPEPAPVKVEDVVPPEPVHDPVSFGDHVKEFFMPGSVTLGLAITDTSVEDKAKRELRKNQNKAAAHSKYGHSQFDPSGRELQGRALFVEKAVHRKEVVKTQTVQLRPVTNIKGDEEFAKMRQTIPSTSQPVFTAVVQREVVLEEKKVGLLNVKKY